MWQMKNSMRKKILSWRTEQYRASREWSVFIDVVVLLMMLVLALIGVFCLVAGAEHIALSMENTHWAQMIFGTRFTDAYRWITNDASFWTGILWFVASFVMFRIFSQLLYWEARIKAIAKFSPEMVECHQLMDEYCNHLFYDRKKEVWDKETKAVLRGYAQDVNNKEERDRLYEGWLENVQLAQASYERDIERNQKLIYIMLGLISLVGFVQFIWMCSGIDGMCKCGLFLWLMLAPSFLHVLKEFDCDRHRNGLFFSTMKRVLPQLKQEDMEEADRQQEIKADEGGRYPKWYEFDFSCYALYKKEEKEYSDCIVDMRKQIKEKVHISLEDYRERIDTWAAPIDSNMEVIIAVFLASAIALISAMWSGVCITTENGSIYGGKFLGVVLTVLQWDVVNITCITFLAAYLVYFYVIRVLRYEGEAGKYKKKSIAVLIVVVILGELSWSWLVKMGDFPVAEMQRNWILFLVGVIVALVVLTYMAYVFSYKMKQYYKLLRKALEEEIRDRETAHTAEKIPNPPVKQAARSTNEADTARYATAPVQ